jgi:hypothetical protein
VAIHTTKYRNTTMLFASDRNNEYKISLQFETVNKENTVSKERTNELNVNLYSSSDTSPPNNERPSIVKVY